MVAERVAGRRPKATYPGEPPGELPPPAGHEPDTGGVLEGQTLILLQTAKGWQRTCLRETSQQETAN